jgi:hypothetical protein
MYETALTLAPDGHSMSGMGGAPPNMQTVIRVGRAPASSRAKDLGSAAKNVTADILGIDRTSEDRPSFSSAAAPSRQPAKRITPMPSEGVALLNTGNDFFNTALRAGSNRNSYLRSAERYYRKAMVEFQKTGDKAREAEARSKLEKVRAMRHRPLEQAPAAKRPAPKTTARKGSLTKEQCAELRGQLNLNIARTKDGSEMRNSNVNLRKELDRKCR